MKLDLISTTATLCLAAGMAQAQTTVLSHQTGATITKGGDWQVLMPENISRHGCRIQNLSAKVMYVYAGSGTATADNSYALIPPATGIAGGMFYCETPGTVIRSAIQVSTSTTGDKLAFDEY